MSDRSSVVLATSAAAAAAVVALAVLVVATVVSSSTIGRIGLGFLFAVPVVRNAVVVGWGNGLERLLAVLGILLVLVIGGVAFSSAEAP
jgi:hypothetical protein